MKKNLNAELELRFEEMWLQAIIDSFPDYGDEVASLILDFDLTPRSDVEVYRDFERCHVTPLEAEIILGNLSYTPSLF